MKSFLFLINIKPEVVKMNLFRLVYVSEKTPSVKVPELETMVEKAQPKNKERGLTGALCLHQDMLLQILEGDSFIWENLQRQKTCQCEAPVF